MTSSRVRLTMVHSGLLVSWCMFVVLQTVYADDVLNDDKWHSVMVRRRQKRLLLQVDNGHTDKSKCMHSPSCIHRCVFDSAGDKGFSDHGKWSFQEKVMRIVWLVDEWAAVCLNRGLVVST